MTEYDLDWSDNQFKRGTRWDDECPYRELKAHKRFIGFVKKEISKSGVFYDCKNRPKL